jgi:hypothetical protein
VSEFAPARNEVACAHEVLWQSRPASSTMPTAAIRTRASSSTMMTTCVVGASATISPQAVLRFSKKGTLRFDEAPNASRFTFLLSRGINPPVADFVPGVSAPWEWADYRPVPWSRPKVERHVELDGRALRLV